MLSPADLNVAKRTLKIKSVNHCVSFVSTLWRGEVIMCCYNNIAKEMANIFCSQYLDAGDVSQLESLIKNEIFLDKPA
jgi:hypothetical protein